jgi:perosamine synthetase
LRLRSHGINQLDDSLVDPILGFTDGKKNLWYQEMQDLGFHYRLSEIQAALGVSQLRKLEKFISKRKYLARHYDELLTGKFGIEPTQSLVRDICAHHLYIILVDFSKASVSRNELMTKLRQIGIGSQVHYRPIPTQPYFKKLDYTVDNLPNAMEYYSRCLSIPLHPKLTKRAQKIINNLTHILFES